MEIDKDDTQTRDLFNALRTGDVGVSFEALMREVYFLQHRTFTLFDAKDAFHASTGKRVDERWLNYRDFQHAVAKLARARYSNASASVGRNASGTHLTATLSAEIATLRQSRELKGSRMDPLRLQMVKHSVLEILEMHLPQLIQSFQMYGKHGAALPHSALASAQDTASTISLDGFLDFLNAYFEYEDYLSFQQVEKMAGEMKSAFALSQEPVLDPFEMHFGQFVELFCRVATTFHHQVLVREGAQLRRAVESCRLEFSIELLLQHMNIKIMRDDSVPHTDQQLAAAAAAGHSDPNVSSADSSLKELTLEVENLFSRSESMTFESLVNDIRIHLETFERANVGTAKRTRQAQSVLISDTIPLVTLICELVSPPPLPPSVLSKFENVVTFQNMGQFHMALGTLEHCKAKYKKWRDSSQHVDIDDDDVEVRVFFHLTAASILESARRDFAALLHHFEALKLSDRLGATPSSASVRALVKSGLGCVLFYAGEVGLAKKCQQQVLDVRTLALGHDHIDTATAMNNLACCLSQDPTGAAMEEAYLLFKSAARIYRAAFGAAHPRVELVQRNFDRVTRCQHTVVVDPGGALERGEYAHVIPGSRFQICALVPIPATLAAKSGSKSKKKKKKSGGGKKSK